MDELIKILEGTLDKPDEGFQVVDYKSANWCAIHITTAEKRVQSIIAFCKEAKKKIEAYEEEATKSDLATIEKMMAFLKPFVEEQIKDMKNKSIKLLDLTAGFRTSKKLEIDDEEKITNILWEQHPSLIVIEKRIDKAGLKKLLEKEQIDGARLVEAENFYCTERKENE